MTLVWSTAAAAAATAQLTASSAAKLDPRAALRCVVTFTCRSMSKKKKTTYSKKADYNKINQSEPSRAEERRKIAARNLQQLIYKTIFEPSVGFPHIDWLPFAAEPKQQQQQPQRHSSYGNFRKIRICFWIACKAKDLGNERDRNCLIVACSMCVCVPFLIWQLPRPMLVPAMPAHGRYTLENGHEN